jgi:acetylornithine aminotransferase
VRLGEKLRKELVKLAGVKFVRGKGLLIGIGLNQSKAKELVQNLLSRGVLVNATSDDLIRIAPPLIIGNREVKLFIREFTASLGEVLDV